MRTLFCFSFKMGPTQKLGTAAGSAESRFEDAEQQQKRQTAAERFGFSFLLALLFYLDLRLALHG